MDVLSDVLDTVRLTSTVFVRTEMSPPWGIRSKPREHFAFHVVSHGTCWLDVDGRPDPVAMAEGDVVVITPGRAHTLRSSLDAIAYDVESLIADGSLCQSIPDRAISANLVCGSFRFDGAHGHPLTSVLPVVLHARRADAEAGPWLAHTVELLAYESFAGRPGNSTVVNKLCDALFVYLLRSHLASSPPSWLRALGDAQIGEALRLMHADPSHPWSVPALASGVGMSRSAFAARFAELVGETPIRYLTLWRLRRADTLLRTTDMTVDAIARAVGYDSAVAFSKAFKRAVGSAPGARRRVMTSPNGGVERETA